MNSYFSFDDFYLYLSIYEILYMKVNKRKMKKCDIIKNEENVSPLLPFRIKEGAKPHRQSLTNIYIFESRGK